MLWDIALKPVRSSLFLETAICVSSAVLALHAALSTWDMR